MLTNEMFCRQILATTETTVNEYFYNDYQGILQEILAFLLLLLLFLLYKNFYGGKHFRNLFVLYIK